MKGALRAPLRAVAIVVVAGVALAGCGRGSDTASSSTPTTSGSDAASSAAAPQEIKVVLASSAVDANISKLIDGMKAAGTELDTKDNVAISLDVVDAGMNSDKQISQIQNAIVKKPDVIIVDPVDLGPLVTVVKQAKAAGIKVYGFRPSDKDPAGLWDGIADETKLETKMTENLKAWLLAQPSPLKAGVIYGAAAQTAQLIRGDVVKAAAEANPAQVTVLATKFGDWSLQIAQDTTANYITSQPELNLIVTANNQMAQGAVNAITSANKASAIQVATYDIDVPTVESVGSGKIAYATGFEMYGYGMGVMRSAIDVVLDRYTGEFDVPVLEVTKDNAAEIKGQLHP